MKQRTIIFIAFLVCLVPRIILTAINTTANDDHIKPISLWIQTGVYPQYEDCWECFQPPFYYGIVKSIAQTVGASSESELRTVFQGLNFIVGFCCLLLIFFFQFKSSLQFKWNLSLALFWGLNPKLIAIGIQATNDIPVIALGMLFIFLLLKWIESKNNLLFAVVLLTVFLAGILKGNGLVLFFILFAVLLFLFVAKRISFSGFSLKTIFLLLLIPAIAFLGGYYNKYTKLGNPFITNLPVASPPGFFTPDSAQGFRKGVTSVWDSFFSFRLKSLMEQPYNTNNLSDDYPLHRTSFFTQLYGQFSNAFFERSPPSWSSDDKAVINFSRANYLIQIPLLVLFLFGFFNAINKSVMELSIANLVHSAAFIIYLVFVIKYAYNIRDFANMKLIFIFPALLSIMYFLQKGTEQLKSISLNKIAFVLVNTSTLLYAINLTYFHIRLFSNL